MLKSARFSINFLFLLLISLITISCSSSSNSDRTVPIATPSNLAVTAKSGEVVVQFSRSAGIGAEGYEVFPYYEAYIGADENTPETLLGNVLSDDSLLVKFTIKKTVTEEDNATITNLFQHDLVDGSDYFIFVKACYDSYGCSGFAKVKATPVPLPTDVTNPKIEVGDKRIIVSWDEKPFEEYSVLMDDCPTKPQQVSKWSPSNQSAGNNRIFSLDNNTAQHIFCMTSVNVNGNSNWHLFGITGTDKIVSADNYTQYQGKDAETIPEKPVITSYESGNKRVTLNFTADINVSKYVIKYGLTSSSLTDNVTADIVKRESSVVVTGLENDKEYFFQLYAENSAGNSVSEVVSVTPKYTEPDLNDPNEILGTAMGAFIFAEDVPHSDFWRIEKDRVNGGRPNSDRLVRGKETALGNLYADGIKWYMDEKNYGVDFVFLAGDLISNGISQGEDITKNFIRSITNINFIDDTIVIAELEGRYLIDEKDYNINLDLYPAVGAGDGNFETLFSQAASVYRNGHYGGSGGTIYNGKFWGIPSKEVRYTIEYKDYDIEAFKIKFETGCSVLQNGIDPDTNALYDVINDPRQCYLMPYAEANPNSGDPTEQSVMGYKRGRILKDSLLINGQPVDPDKRYKIATTKKIADTMYIAFLNGTVSDTGVTVIDALANYVYNKKEIVPYLDGRVKLKGGVPGDTANDFK